MAWHEHYLPRLPPEFYCGDAVVHWTCCIEQKKTGWLNDTFHFRFRELMIHAAVRQKVVCPLYCLMPDHFHFLWMGLHLESNQLNGMAFLRTYLKKLLAPIQLQPQSHDMVLREKEREQNAFARVGYYILNNPVRSGLVTSPELWKYSGSVVPGYPELEPTNSKFWEIFWKIYRDKRQPNSGERKLPPRSLRNEVGVCPWNKDWETICGRRREEAGGL